MDIKSEPYTEDKKAYLTYDPTPIAKSRLLSEHVVSTDQIYIDGVMIYSVGGISLKTRKLLEDDGFIIKTVKKTVYYGKTSFDADSMDKIPVVIRKIQYKGTLKQIRVRITAKTHEELMERTYAIRDTLAAYGLKHKLCVWDRTGDI